MIKELRRLEEKHKNDKVDTFENNWSAMCHDVANRLEEQQLEIDKLIEIWSITFKELCKRIAMKELFQMGGIMENQFYQLCKELDCCGTMELNIPLLSCNEMGVRFTLRQGSTYATTEVTNKELVCAGQEVYRRVFDELRYELQKELKKRALQEKMMCSTCIKRDVGCSCDCTREYRKRDGV